MVMLGDIFALAGAATFAISSSMIKRLNIIGNVGQLNFIRTLIGAIIFLTHLLLIAKVGVLVEISSVILLYLTLSVTFNVVLGDTSFFEAQNRLGVKIATPLVNTFPYLTIIIAVIFLDESVTSSLIFGSFLLIPGVILLSLDKIDPVETYIKQEGDQQNSKIIGFFLISFSILCYALGIIFTTLGTKGLDPIVANSIRLPVGSLGLMLLVTIQPRISHNINGWTKLSQSLRESTGQDRLILLIAGVFGTYLSSLFLVLSVQEIGASRSAILFSTGPFFALPLAIVWLSERISKITLIGTALTVVGLWIILS